MADNHDRDLSYLDSRHPVRMAERYNNNTDSSSTNHYSNSYPQSSSPTYSGGQRYNRPVRRDVRIMPAILLFRTFVGSFLLVLGLWLTGYCLLYLLIKKELDGHIITIFGLPMVVTGRRRLTCDEDGNDSGLEYDFGWFILLAVFAGFNGFICLCSFLPESYYYYNPWLTFKSTFAGAAFYGVFWMAHKPLTWIWNKISGR